LMSMPVGRGPFRLPLGPLTWICCSLTDSSTPLGRVIGFFATRDMSIVSLCHDGEDFAAQALLARMRIGHHAPGRGDDADTQATQHPGQLALAAVLAQAGPADAAQLFNDWTTLEILQENLDLLLARAGVAAGDIVDVTLFLEDAGDF